MSMDLIYSLVDDCREIANKLSVACGHAFSAIANPNTGLGIRVNVTSHPFLFPTCFTISREILAKNCQIFL